MWGIVPAAGRGSRIQPLAFSKELLPVGSRIDGAIERPKAVSEFLIERMMLAGADKICVVISPGKSDIIEYYGGGLVGANFCYTVQQQPKGLCDAIFRAHPMIHPDEIVVVGLPDTIWFPENGLSLLPDGDFSFLLFPVENPEYFDSVLMDKNNNIQRIAVKQKEAPSNWIWGAFKLTGKILSDLRDLWIDRNKSDEYIGTLANAYIKQGGVIKGVQAGSDYVDVGTLNGYREAINLLNPREEIV